MSTIAITGATGHLGRLVVTSVLSRGVDPATVVAVVRNPAKAAEIAALGVEVREAAYEDQAALEQAFAGVDRLLFISSSDGDRSLQHKTVVAAAQAAGVGQVSYTSVLNADTTTMQLAAVHQETEQLLRDSGLPFVFLRNGWYTENYTDALAPTLEHGLVGSAGDGRVALAARQDYADAAAAVLTTDGHDGQAYELAGDAKPTLTELAAAIATAAGQDVAYVDVPVEQYAEILAGAGVPVPFNEILADSSVAIKRGELVGDSGDFARLIGRPTTPVADTLALAV